MLFDRSIAEDRTLRCACGECFDVLEWQLIDVAARLDLVHEVGNDEIRLHRCPACGIAHGRLMQLGLLIDSPWEPASIIAVVEESGDDPAHESAWCTGVRLQMLEEPVRFVKVPWDWVELICALDFDAPAAMGGVGEARLGELGIQAQHQLALNDRPYLVAVTTLEADQAR